MLETFAGTGVGRRAITLTLLLIICVISAPLSSAEKKPDPSDLSISERLVRRTAARQATLHTSSVGANSSQQNGSQPAFVIDGSRTPELFIPCELMSMLLDTYALSPKSRAMARNQYHTAIVSSFHWNEAAFWRDVDAAATGYFQAAYANQGKARTTAASRAICAKRATTLEQMRKRYPNFDRFLYGDFAERQTLAAADDQSEAWLVWVNGGCR